MGEFYAIEGNIGAGKTTLARLLARKLGAELVLEEFADNLFLPSFYKDPERFAFPLELSFLADRYHQLNRLSDGDKLIVSDYYIHKSLIFADHNLKGNELALFRRMYSIMFETVRRPTKLLYLDAGIDTLRQRISGRGRHFEVNIPDAYLDGIRQRYLDYLKEQVDLPVLFVDVETHDFVGDADDFRWLIDVLGNTYAPGTHILKR
jgi:deoxyadenosine/deoxycytidine kinase